MHFFSFPVLFLKPSWITSLFTTYGWQGLKSVERAIIKKEENKKMKTIKYGLLVEGLVHYNTYHNGAPNEKKVFLNKFS